MSQTSDKNLVWSILEYLQELSQGKDVEEGLVIDSESLNVAQECLTSAFGLDLKNEEQKKQYGTGNSLRSIFHSHKPSPSSSTTTSTSSSSSESDPRFDAYIQLLTKRNFFEGAPEGSEEYKTRYETAKKRYEASNIAKTPSSTATPATTATPPKEDISSLSAEEWKNKGNALLQASPPKPQEAIEAYTNAITLNGSNAVFYANRASAHIVLSQYQEAIADCQKSIEIQPSYSKSYFRLGQAYEALGQLEDALTQGYEKAAELEPANLTLQAKIDAIKTKLAAPPAANPFAEMAGNPDLSSLAGVFGGGGPPDIGSILSNPQKMQEIMSNPFVAKMLNDPKMREMAASMMQNPDLLKGMFSGGLPK